jgi:hypothetical protein
MLKMKTRQKNPDILRTKKVEKNCNFPSHFSKVYLKKQTKYQIVSGETRAAKDHVNFGVLPFLLHFYRFWVNITVGGLLIPKGIIRLVVSVSTLRRFIKYIYY